jgi:8-oxo-dGTP pyrophosphatase MutT (NUDIX family)
MLYSIKPENITDWLKVAACFIECNGKILLLKRPKNHKFHGTWIEPGWKIDQWETPEEAMIREVFEESGILISKWQATQIWTKYFYFDNMNICITFFHYKPIDKPEIILNLNESHEHVWQTPLEALKLNLIDDLDEILKTFFIQDQARSFK